MGDGNLCIPRERGNTFRRMDFPAEWAMFMDFLRRMGDDDSRMGDVARRMGDVFRRMGDVLTEWATVHSAFPSPNGRRFDFFLKFSVWPRRDCSHGPFSVAEWAMIGSAGDGRAGPRVLSTPPGGNEKKCPNAKRAISTPKGFSSSTPKG